MKAIILAAGRGTRMKPLTDSTPKPLLPYGPHTLLEELLSRLQATGRFERFVIINGYLGSQIVERIGSTWRGTPVTHARQRKTLGTYDSLRCARGALQDGERFLVIHPDDLHDQDALTDAAAHPHAIVAAEVDDPRPFGVVELEGRFVRRIVEKPEVPTSNLVSTAAIVTDTRIFEPRFAPAPVAGRELMIPDAICAMIASGVHFHAVRARHWFPISTAADLTRANARRNLAAVR